MSLTLRAEILVPVPIERAWDVWVDAARYPQWQGGVLNVQDLVGSVGVTGATYVLDHGPKLKRRVRVTTAERPSLHVMEQEGVGAHDQTTATFEPEGDGTRLTLAIHMHLNAVLRVLARFDRRSRLEREIQAELERFRDVATRTAATPAVGEVHLVQAGPFRRRLTVIGLDEDRVHVRLHPGHLRERDADDHVPPSPKPLTDQMDLWPIPPPLRGGGAITAQGLPFLLRDGGHGIEHLALSMDAWADGAPRAVGMAEPRPDDRAAIEHWLARRAPVVGQDVGLDFAPVCSLRLGTDAEGEGVWAVATVIRRELMRVHLAIAGERWATRPEAPPTWRHAVVPRDADAFPGPPAGGGPPWPPVGHVPVDRATFKAAAPQGIGVTTLESSQLDGFRAWREAKGGTMTSLQPFVDMSWLVDPSRIDEPGPPAVDD
jgi:uncharacterized protein YndB with AHSA1/START domain